MSLSICLMTADPAYRVASILEPLLPYADEVVIAADARVDEHTRAGYDVLADKLFLVQYRAIERHMAWMFAQCSGDWVLRLDGDEVPSAAFVRELPELLDRRDVQQFWVAIDWLFPDATHYLGGAPWSEDFSGRLLRNDGTLRFRGAQHMHADPVSPRGYLSAPFYHLNLLTSSEKQRREKAIRYEAARPGVRAVGGGRINEAFYLPEQRDHLELHAVPEEDRAAIERALAPAPAPDPGAPRERVSAPYVSLSTMDRFWELRTVPDGAYSATLEPYEAEVSLTPGELRSLLLYVTNGGCERWPARLDEKPAIRLGHRWLNLDGSVHTEDGPRSPFLRTVQPGDRFLVPLEVVAPSEPGEYLLEADVVHEHVRWFGCACRVRTRVGEPPAGRPLSATAAPLPSDTHRLLIPRTIHRVWLGEEPMPERYQRFGESFAAHHPDWEMRLWGDADLEALAITDAEREACRTLAELSNLVRYELLSRFGGVYVDSDVECRRPLGQLLDGVHGFAALQQPDSVGIAILGAVPAHPLFTQAARLARRTLGEGERPEYANGPYFLTLLIEQHADVTIFDSSLFYPHFCAKPERYQQQCSHTHSQ